MKDAYLAKLPKSQQPVHGREAAQVVVALVSR